MVAAKDRVASPVPAFCAATPLEVSPPAAEYALRAKGVMVMCISRMPASERALAYVFLYYRPISRALENMLLAVVMVDTLAS